MRLEGKVAIVTGAGSGFGREIAIRCAEEGAAILIADIDGAGAIVTESMVQDAGSSAALAVVDVSTGEGAAAVAAKAVDRFGAIDILVNNAGIVQPMQVDSWDCDESVWNRVLEVNLRSVYACTRAVVPKLLERGGGCVVNVSSIGASCWTLGGAAYAASKGGIVSFTHHVARELAARNVRVNCVSPGFMRSPMTTGEREGLTPEEQETQIAQLGRRVPMGRAGEARDVANAVLYLASDESSYITGREIVVDGGYLVR
jgi:NAD(P)-dependent dehydrogenase (short-subunit alcohol dehydrogenase family)